MKKYLTALCLLVVAAGAFFGMGGEAWAKGEVSTGERRLSATVPAHKSVALVYTYNSANIAFLDQLDSPIPAKTGYMLMALSPSEHIEFQDGKIIRYISIELSSKSGQTARKTFFNQDIAPSTSGGGRWDGDEISLSFRIFDVTPQKRLVSNHETPKPLDVSALTIRTDGRECKVSYLARQKQYSLHCEKLN